jgi:hypothetical protein
MQITLHIEQDAEAASCPWDEVAGVVRNWAAAYVTPAPDLLPAPAGGMALSLALPAAVFLPAVSQLHQNLYELRVNFTLSVD